jgi:hypothetical protein
MQNHTRSHQFGQMGTIGVVLLMLSSLICSHAAADIRPIPDPGITDKTVILVPNHAVYRVTIDGVLGGRQRAPFGSGGGCPLQTTVNSSWPVGTQIVLRKSFTLPTGASNLRVLLSIDNDVEVFLNGNEITPGTVIHEFCPLVDEFLFTAPDTLLIAGTNRLVIQATDRGSESYLDLRVLVDMP